MALKITLRPNEKMIIDGAVISNGGTTSNFLIENEVPVLREKNIMSEKDADSPCRRIYFVIQLMYIDRENLTSYHDRYWKLVRELIDAAPSLLGIIDEISEQIRQQPILSGAETGKTTNFSRRGGAFQCTETHCMPTRPLIR